MFLPKMFLIAIALAITCATPVPVEKIADHQIQLPDVPISNQILNRQKRFVLPGLLLFLTGFGAGAAGVASAAGVAGELNVDDSEEPLLLSQDGAQMIPLMLLPDSNEVVAPNRLAKRSTTSTSNILSRKRRFVVVPGW